MKRGEWEGNWDATKESNEKENSQLYRAKGYAQTTDYKSLRKSSTNELTGLSRGRAEARGFLRRQSPDATDA